MSKQLTTVLIEYNDAMENVATEIYPAKHWCRLVGRETYKEALQYLITDLNNDDLTVDNKLLRIVEIFSDDSYEVINL